MRAGRAVILTTERLELVRATVDRLRADLAGPASLAVALAASVPDTWPPDLYDRGATEWALRYAMEHPVELQWGMYYVIDPAATGGPAVAGIVGFKGGPEDGIVEIGYSILPDFRRRGYATEAVAALVELAFAHDEVDRVVAETLPDLDASIGVLRTSGFVLVGAGGVPGAIRYELTRAGRNDGMTERRNV
jgi:RimJ/RimL family protein N-acetyltransferase